MRYAYAYDENFIYLRPTPFEIVKLEDGNEEKRVPKNATKTPPPEGLFMPKWDANGNRWIEGATQDYIDEIVNKQPTVVNTDTKTDLSAQLEETKVQLAETQKQLQEILTILGNSNITPK